MIRLRRTPANRPGRHRRDEPTLAPGIRATTRETQTQAISPQTRLRAAGYVKAHVEHRERSALVRWLDRFRQEEQ